MERTIYCEQPYHRTRGGLVEGHMRRLLSCDAAMKAARGMRGCADGVIVFSRTGSWEADYWGEAQLVARAGDVPRDVPTPLLSLVQSAPLPRDDVGAAVDAETGRRGGALIIQIGAGAVARVV
jgi:hypothetical protein